jgi:hypothetical protein
MAAGWFPDPTGRFPTRHHDGSDWTDHVQGPDGQVEVDPLERRSSGLPAPAPAAGWAPSPGGPAPMAGPAPGGPPPAAGPAPIAKGTGFLGVAIAGFGWLLAALSLLVLDWVDGAGRGDIADALPGSLPDSLADIVAYTYVRWAGLALLVLVALGLASVLLGLLGRDPTVLRFLVAGLVLVAVVLHAFAVARGLRDAAEVGAHLGTFAYLVVIAGLAVGSHTRRTT